MGSTSRVARALAQVTGIRVVHSLSRKQYEALSPKDFAVSLKKTNTVEEIHSSTVIVNCVGVTDPSANYETLIKWNYDFCLKLYDLSKILGTQYLSFGSMSEDFLDSKLINRYTQSKCKLTAKVVDINDSEWLHLRLHTLYGNGFPPKHMLLGQLYFALKSGEPMSMTKGKQIREHHHVSDEAKAIKLALESNLTGVQDLNFGNAVSLASLVGRIAKEFGSTSLIKLGELPEQKGENFTKHYPLSPFVSDMVVRPTVEGIINWFQELGLTTKERLF